MYHRNMVQVPRSRIMDDTSLALEGFCLERKDRDHRRGGGVACYIRNDIEYNRLR